MGDLKRLASYLGPYRRDLFIGAVLVVVESGFELLIPVLMADLIDVGVARRDLNYIFHKGVQMGLCALLALVCRPDGLRLGRPDPGGGVREGTALRLCQSGPL